MDKLDIDLPVKGSFAQCQSSNLTHEIGKYDFRGGGKSSLLIWGKLSLLILGGGKSCRRFTLKSSSISYTKLSVRFTPPPKSAGTIYPKSAVMIYPNWQWRFTPSPPPKSAGTIYPKSAVMIYPPPQICSDDLPQICKIEQNFRHTTSCFASQRSFLRKTKNLWYTMDKKSRTAASQFASCWKQLVFAMLR